jgi:hypothetical protein
MAKNTGRGKSKEQRTNSKQRTADTRQQTADSKQQTQDGTSIPSGAPLLRCSLKAKGSSGSGESIHKCKTIGPQVGMKILFAMI